MTGDGSPRPLPPPVPPDPRKRPVVGEGIHRVDQRGPGRAALPRPRPAPSARRSRLLRPAGARGAGGPGRPGPASRGHRLLLLALLVRRAPAPPAPARRGRGLGRARLPVLRGVGQPELVGDLARRAEPDPHRADLPRSRGRPARTSPSCGRLRGSRATSGSAAGRCSSSTSPATSPSRPGSSTGGRRWPTTPGWAGCTWWRRWASPTTASHVSDGFDAAVYFQFPFGRDGTDPGAGAAAWPGASSAARCATPMPTVAAGPPPRRRRPPLPERLPQLGQHPPRRAGGAWWPPGRPRSGSAVTCGGPSSWPRPIPAGEQVVVIKSWNEWAEGNYLEPDAEFGLGRLEALPHASSPVRGCARPLVTRDRGHAPGRAARGRCPRSRRWPGRCRTWRCRPWPARRAGPGARDRRSTARGRRPAGPGCPGGTTSPFTPSVTIWGTPPTAVATIAAPTLAASIRATGRPSWWEASTKMSAAASSRRASSRWPRNRNRSPRPSWRCLATSSASLRPWPAAANRTGRPRCHEQARRVEQDVVALLRPEIGHGDDQHVARRDPELGPHLPPDLVRAARPGPSTGTGRHRGPRPGPVAAGRREGRRRRPGTRRRGPGRSGRWPG